MIVHNRYAVRGFRFSVSRSIAGIFILLCLFPAAGSALGGAYALVEQGESRPEVQRSLDRFLTRERAFIQRGFDNAAHFLPTVERLFQDKGVPAELVFLPLIESAFSPQAYSRAGAAGLWQFMASTATWRGLRIDYWVDERRDPVRSTTAALTHLKYLFEYYRNWDLALAAYNAGTGSVNLAIKRGKTDDYWQLCSKRLLKRETREYVPRFIAAALIARDPEKYGFSIGEHSGFGDYEMLELNRPVDLTVLSTRSSIPLQTLKFLNPELNRLITPVGRRYELRIPEERFTEAFRAYHDLPEEDLVGVERRIVRFGDTLGGIAERYHTSVTLLRHLNNIQNPKRLYAGQSILIPVTSRAAPEAEKQVVALKRGFHTQEIEYIVQKGDTLWEIARKFNSDIEVLLYVNGMGFGSVILPGDEIKLWLDLAFSP
jgi:membrane-bound lytic murein transglycosylase D